MSKTIDIEIKETEKELLSSLRTIKVNWWKNELESIITCKKIKMHISQQVVNKVGASRKSIYNWFKIYKKEGIKKLCEVRFIEEEITLGYYHKKQYKR